MSYALNAPGLPTRDRSLDLTARVGGIGIVVLMILGAVFYVMLHNMVIDRAADREAAMMIDAPSAIDTDAGSRRAAVVVRVKPARTTS